MINLAGGAHDVVDIQCTKELRDAGFPLMTNRREIFRSKCEVPSNIIGYYSGWELSRAWYYWVARWHPPQPVCLTMEEAVVLHELIGKEVRVNGDCTSPSPMEWWGEFYGENAVPDHYHIDTPDGLLEFAKAVGAYGKPDFDMTKTYKENREIQHDRRTTETIG